MQIQGFFIHITNYCSNNVTIVNSLIKNLRNRKTIIFALLICVFVVYFMSSYLLPPHRHFHANKVQSLRKTESCLDPFIEKWKVLIAENKAILKEIPGSTKENRFFPFTGNGYAGFNSDNNAFYLLKDKESIDVQFSPILQPRIIEKNSFEKKALILNMNDGVINILTSFLLETQQCVVIEETIYMHRVHQHLIFYEAVVKNNGYLPVTVKFDLPKPKPKVKITNKDINDKDAKNRFTFIHSKIEDISKVYDTAYVSAAISEYQSTVNVPQKSKNTLSIRAFIKSVVYEQHDSSHRSKKSILTAQEKKIEEELTEAASKDLLQIMQLKNEVLLQQHKRAWEQTWEVGTNVSSDNDPATPTALHVNLLYYYLYSSVLYNLSHHDLVPIDCSSEDAAAHNADLWVVPLSIKQFYTNKLKWTNYLTSSHCLTSPSIPSLFTLRELIILSFMGLQYKTYHLQLALNPLNLHSNLSVHNIGLERFNSKDTVDLQILTTNYNGEHRLQVQCMGNHNPKIYGCPVACDYTIELTNSLLSFPIRNTNPVTPIFYISTNKSHLEKLGSSSFLRKAKANAMNTHKVDLEVHHFKLSPKFWFAVIVLIVTFHLIVIKMVYNECRRDRNFTRRRTPFS